MNNIISIVTPSYNQAQFITETIESIWSQEGNFEIEHIVIDGLSTDGTQEILNKYEERLKNKKYPLKCNNLRFIWKSEKDSGQAEAINKGFMIAKGDIVTWINSDDYYEPGSFNYVLRKYQKHSRASIVYGNCRQINEKGELIKKIKARKTSFKEMLTFGGNAIPQPASFYRKQALDQAGYLDETLHYSLDYDLFLRLSRVGELIACNRILSNFRIWEQSKSYSQKQSFVEDRKRVRQKYGGPIIDIKQLYPIVDSLKFPKYLCSRFPKLYSILKKLFFFVYKKLHYRN